MAQAGEVAALERTALPRPKPGTAGVPPATQRASHSMGGRGSDESILERRETPTKHSRSQQGQRDRSADGSSAPAASTAYSPDAEGVKEISRGSARRHPRYTPQNFRTLKAVSEAQPASFAIIRI